MEIIAKCFEGYPARHETDRVDALRIRQKFCVKRDSGLEAVKRSPCISANWLMAVFQS